MLRLSRPRGMRSFLVLAFLSITAAEQCTTPDNTPGQCILLRNCSSLRTLITKKPLLDADRIFLVQSMCGRFSNDYHPFVCCPVPAGVKLLPTPGKCGGQTSERIYGGENTRIDEVPWIALLKYAKPHNVFGFNCGGVLINDRYVLTAAHCVNGVVINPRWNLTEVRLGEWDISTSKDCEGLDGDLDCSPEPIDIPIEKKIPHPEYVPKLYEQYNDIALLRLQKSVKYSYFVQPICLPLHAELKTRVYVGRRMQVAGWGATETSWYSNVKKKVIIEGVSLDTCNRLYMSRQFQLRQTQLCAGGEDGKDACQGDSGGPLAGIHKANGQKYWYLVGLVSLGPTPCGQAGRPAIYTKVDQYVDWITATIVA